jgi:hypothetical protein
MANFANVGRIVLNAPGVSTVTDTNPAKADLSNWDKGDPSNTAQYMLPYVTM